MRIVIQLVEYTRVMHVNADKRNIEIDIAEDHEWVKRIGKTNHFDKLVVTPDGKDYLEKFDSIKSTLFTAISR